MNAQEINDELNSPDHWQISPGELKSKFEFEDFVAAFGFMTKIAMKAEKLNHHPTWSNTYNTVEITLTTHDDGNKVTEKDIELANYILSVYEKYR